MRAKYLIIPALLLFLSGCELLPEEEPLRTAPLIETYANEQVYSIAVERGDMILTESVSCRYVPVQTAKLSFSLGGEYIDRLFVEAGDAVRKGQLLGRLRLTDLESRIEAAESAIEEYNLEMDHVRALYELELRRFEITGRALDEQARLEALDELNRAYGAELSRIEAQCSLQKMTKETLEAEIDERCIYAPFDGTVTAVSKVADGELSAFGVPVITLVDSTLSIFRAETEYWDRFVPGGEYEITVNKKTYPTVVVDEAELGLEPTKHIAGEYGVVYFALREPSFELEDGDRGSVTLTLDQRIGVLQVPEKAVSSVDGQPIVYYMGEDGLKTYKPVETGLAVNGYIEILSGLSEGENIIAD